MGTGAACALCREPLGADGSCLFCLLSLGLPETRLDGDEPFPGAGDAPTDYGDFEIVRREDGSPWELGRGAMGITYRAVDRVLHRPVALKVIQLGAANSVAGWRNDALRERFLREARAAAALRHANVAGVFQFGAAAEASRCFFAMELVEGETLEARVRRLGPLGVPAALEVARQVTAALAAAADRGLVHRDLKPGNLMLADGGDSSAGPEVKVIDFGLAQAAADVNEADPAQGGFAGTPTFASPEQMARQSVDARSDLYSLGITLWYALTGRAPFTGRTLEELRRDPARVHLPVEQLRAKRVPAGLIALLRRLLAVDPADRPASARELAPALDACRRRLDVGSGWSGTRLAAMAAALTLVTGVALWEYFGIAADRRIARPREPLSASSGRAISEKSIAVLPFQNASADPGNAFFTDGVQDEILTHLARVADLKVISRASVISYKSENPRDLREIAAQLGVAHILEGSVQRAGNTVRVTALLSDARRATQEWAMRYDRPLDDAFAIQSEIAQAIADQLRARITPEEQAGLARAATKDVLAFQLYQHARELKGHNSDPSAGSRLFEAVDLLGEAVKRDPEFLQAWCLLAEVELDLYWEGLDKTDARRQSSLAAVEHAARLGPDAGETHLVRAIYLYHGLSDYRRALDELSLARRTLPNHADIPFYAAAIFRRQGRWEESLREFKSVAELDPHNFPVLSETAHTEEAMEHYAEATRRYNQALAVQPGDVYTRERLVMIPYLERADTRPLQALNAAILASEPEAVEASAYFRLVGALADRDPAAARVALAGFPARGFPTTDFYVPPEWFAGLTARTFGDEAGAHGAFLAAREKVARVVREHPDYAVAWGVLGWIDAGLGRKEEAVREGRRGCELMPPDRDAYNSPNLVGYLAMIYAWCGEKDLALQTLAQVIHARVGISSNTRYGSLKLDPQWDPLRGDPRFEALVASLAPTP